MKVARLQIFCFYERRTVGAHYHKYYLTPYWDAEGGVKGQGEAFWDHTLENCFGEVWGRPGLSLRDRQLVTLGVLIDQSTDGILPHMRNAHKMGITVSEMREIIFQAMCYTGWPRGSAANLRFNAVLNEPNCSWPEGSAKTYRSK